MNWTLVGIAVPAGIWLLGLSFALGRLWEKVHDNCVDIENNRKENREDHRQIYNKLDDLVKMLKNGYGKGAGGN